MAQLPGRALLIRQRGQAAQYTLNRTVDARTALCLGLSQYLEDAVRVDFEGKALKFSKVFATFAEAETQQVLPAAIVTADGPIAYDSSKLSPAVDSRYQVTPGVYLASSCELSTDLVLEIWASYPEQREQMVSACEDALTPVDWQFGVTIELPFYFNERAVYSLGSVQYLDDTDRAIKDYRLARIMVSAHMPVTRVMHLAAAQPRSQVSAQVGGSLPSAPFTRSNP